MIPIRSARDRSCHTRAWYGHRHLAQFQRYADAVSLDAVSVVCGELAQPCREKTARSNSSPVVT